MMTTPSQKVNAAKPKRARAPSIHSAVCPDLDSDSFGTWVPLLWLREHPDESCPDGHERPEADRGEPGHSEPDGPHATFARQRNLAAKRKRQGECDHDGDHLLPEELTVVIPLAVRHDHGDAGKN